jgi:hypothetical protein
MDQVEAEIKETQGVLLKTMCVSALRHPSRDLWLRDCGLCCLHNVMIRRLCNAAR